MAVVLFGSIGTIADTSELQRAAFNDAFRQHGLDWNWSRQEYRELLRDSGGASRIASYAEARGDEVDAEAVHRTKSELFQGKLRASRPALRPGLVDTIEQARRNGYKLALVTTTSCLGRPDLRRLPGREQRRPRVPRGRRARRRAHLRRAADARPGRLVVGASGDLHA
jgi:beta-phosphoglucomutase-like phosphatase (HAD superfamily)